MPAEKIFVVASREYLSRIKTKGFWISTLILPVAIIAMMFLPAVFITKSGISHSLIVVDETGRIGEELVQKLAEAKGPDGQLAKFKVELRKPSGDSEAQRAELNERVLDGAVDAWLWIGPDILLPRSSELTEKERGRRRVTYHGESVSNFLTQDVLRDNLSDIVRRLRLTDAGYDPQTIMDLTPRVRLETVRVSSEGETAENTMVGFILAYALAMLLYILIVIYGQQILNGVIEEKMSRVVEVVISTVKPFELMLGKLIGIGLVGLTQVGVWIGAVIAVTTPALVAAIVTLPEGFRIPTVSLWVVLNFGIFFFLGYFVYCTFYAAIGAAFNNIQEAQQFAIVAVVFLVIPLMLMPVVINDPDGATTQVMSLIPPFTPILMMLRVAVKSPPVSEVLLSYALTGGFALFMVWACSRIYRIGILMYGKKPTVKELYKWVRHA